MIPIDRLHEPTNKLALEFNVSPSKISILRHKAGIKLMPGPRQNTKKPVSDDQYNTIKPILIQNPNIRPVYILKTYNITRHQYNYILKH